MSVPTRTHRPRIVTLLILGVFLFGIWNAGQALAIAKESRLMLALDVTLDPRIRMGMALAWTVMFGGLAVAMWQKRPFAQRALPLLLTVYALTELIRQLLFVQVVHTQQVWLTGIFYLILLIICRWSLKRPFAQTYFGKTDSNAQDVI